MKENILDLINKNNKVKNLYWKIQLNMCLNTSLNKFNLPNNYIIYIEK